MFYEAEQLYFSQNKKYGSLGELIDRGFIDRSFSSGNRFNYHLEIEPEDSRYDAFATPVWNWKTGLGSERRLSFYINDQNIFTRAEKQGGRAGANDEPIPR